MFQVSKRPSLFRALFNFYSIMDNTYARVVYSYARERCAPLRLSSPPPPSPFPSLFPPTLHFISLFYYLSPAKFRALFSKTLQLITTLPPCFSLFSVHTTLSFSLSLSLPLSFRVHLFDRSFPAKAWYITPFTVDPRLFRARIFHDLFRTFITSIFGILSLSCFFLF